MAPDQDPTNPAPIDESNEAHAEDHFDDQPEFSDGENEENFNEGPPREGGREGGRDDGREGRGDDRGRRDGGRDGNRDGGRDGRRDRGRGRGRDDDRPPRERIGSFEQMKVWQEAHQLTLKVFAVTPKLPDAQQAGLALQMEQAAAAVPKGIAEGFRRRGPRNKAHFYNIAQSSLEGLRYYFILCRDLGYDIGYQPLADHTEQVSRMLDGLIRSMQRG